ncbi:MAG TPA: hypothetical protein VF188_08675 [Longimicrobiales bacterium]
MLRQAVHEAGARGIALLDDGTPEARLAADWAIRALGPDAVTCIEMPDPAAAAAALAAAGPTARLDPARAAEEVLRLRARAAAAEADLLPAHPANKTALLLAGGIPPEPLLPLGDLYASQVRELAGASTAPPCVRALADCAGGLDRLDALLVALVDERRRPAELPDGYDGATVAAVRRALDAGRWSRRRIGLVPKLGSRTLGIDLFD